jgi:hypothetical protein
MIKEEEEGGRRRRKKKEEKGTTKCKNEEGENDEHPSTRCDTHTHTHTHTYSFGFAVDEKTTPTTISAVPIMSFRVTFSFNKIALIATFDVTAIDPAMEATRTWA